MRNFYADSNGKMIGMPFNSSTPLLYYNKDMVAECPADSDALIEVAKANTDIENGKYGIVYRQDESFWLVPFLTNGVLFPEQSLILCRKRVVSG